MSRVAVPLYQLERELTLAGKNQRAEITEGAERKNETPTEAMHYPMKATIKLSSTKERNQAPIEQSKTPIVNEVVRESTEIVQLAKSAKSRGDPKNTSENGSTKTASSTKSQIVILKLTLAKESELSHVVDIRMPMELAHKKYPRVAHQR